MGPERLKEVKLKIVCVRMKHWYSKTEDIHILVLYLYMVCVSM